MESPTPAADNAPRRPPALLAQIRLSLVLALLLLLIWAIWRAFHGSSGGQHKARASFSPDARGACSAARPSARADLAAARAQLAALRLYGAAPPGRAA